LSSDFSFDRHVSIVSASSFYWLRQFQRSRRSLDTESAATLVNLFVASRIDYCNAVLAGAPKATTNKLQRVLNAAARVVSGTHKFYRGLSRLLYRAHWLDVPERVVYKVTNSMHRSALWCSTACTVKRLRTSWNCANQSQVSHHIAMRNKVYIIPPRGSVTVQD